MTSLRISENILKYNDPRGRTGFNEILVSKAITEHPSDYNTTPLPLEVVSAANQTGSGGLGLTVNINPRDDRLPKKIYG